MDPGQSAQIGQRAQPNANALADRPPITPEDWRPLFPYFPPLNAIRPGTTYELEARFKPLGDVDRRGIDKSIYHRLLVALEHAGYDHEQSQSLIYLGIETSDAPRTNNIIRSTPRLMIEQTPTGAVHHYQLKETWAPHDHVGYGIRISLSRETDLFPVPAVATFPYTGTRNRFRHSFTIVPGVIRVDLTTVTATPRNGTPHMSYEIELELLTPPSTGDMISLTVFSQNIISMWSLLHQSELFYTFAETALVDKFLTEQLGSEHRSALVESRNLKSADLVLGGIVGNQYLNTTVIQKWTHLKDVRAKENPMDQKASERPGTRYAVTYKADGLRMLLIFLPLLREGTAYFSVWMVHPPHHYNLVLVLPESRIRGKGVTGTITDLYYSMFDGELIRHAQVPARYYYLAFDLLCYRNKSTQDLNYLLRMGVDNLPTGSRASLGRGAIGLWQGFQKGIVQRFPYLAALLAINYKSAWILNTVDDFFSYTRRLLTQIENKELPYPEDGLMYVPIDIIYNPRSDKIPIAARKLTSIPDTCKWKPAAKITIDFSLHWRDDGTLNLRSTNFTILPTGRTHVEAEDFVGDAFTPVHPEDVDYRNPVLYPGGIQVASRTVAEFAWLNNRLVPTRLRFDKVGPNSLAVALDNWRAIRNPLTAEDISGTTLKLAFKSHSAQKRELFNMVAEKQGLNILDIGGGVGGDGDKWKTLIKTTGRVVTVEPDAAHIAQMAGRLATFGIADQVQIVQTTGEASKTITAAVQQWFNGPADIISIMLSLSFFWETSAHLDALVSTVVHTLKPGGQIIFFTIDGAAVTQLFEPALGGDRRTAITLGNGQFTLFPAPTVVGRGRMLELDIPDTIMGRQQEYLVMIDDFTSRLLPYGIILEDFHRAGAPVWEEIGYESDKGVVPMRGIRKGGKLVYPFMSNDQQVYNNLFSWGRYRHHGALITDPAYDFVAARPTNTVISPQITLSPVLPIVLPLQALSIKPPTIVNPLQAPSVQTLLPIPAVFEPHTHLPILPVGSPSVLGAPAPGDDRVEALTCTWLSDLVRIAVIGDGSCFIHALLKGMNRTYQNHNSYLVRRQMVQYLRRDLALMLSMPDPHNPGLDYWETANNGTFLELFTLQVLANELNLNFAPDDAEEQQKEARRAPMIVDYGLNGLRRLFNSSSYLGNEVYGFITEVLSINLCILQATTIDLYNISYDYRNPQYPTVIIIGNTVHYEVVGLQTLEGIQTLFDFDSPVVQTLLRRFPQEPPREVNASERLLHLLLDYPDSSIHPTLPDGKLDMRTFVFPQYLATMFADDDPFLIRFKSTIRQLLDLGYQVYSPFL